MWQQSFELKHFRDFNYQVCANPHDDDEKSWLLNFEDLGIDRPRILVFFSVLMESELYVSRTEVDYRHTEKSEERETLVQHML